MAEALSTHPRFTRRFVLRPFRRRDADSLLEAVLSSLSELNRWLPWAHLSYSRSDAGTFVRDSIRSWQDGHAFDLAIRSPAEPERHVGNVSVWWISRPFRTGEIGYWVRTDETRKGVATEVVARVLEIAFDEMNLHRVVLRIAEGNRGSERVAEKLGFIREGLLREEIRVRGQWLDHSVWGLLEHEYRRNRQRYEAVASPSAPA